VSDSEIEQMPERIRAHFDRVRVALNDALSGE